MHRVDRLRRIENLRVSYEDMFFYTWFPAATSQGGFAMNTIERPTTIGFATFRGNIRSDLSRGLMQVRTRPAVCSHCPSFPLPGSNIRLRLRRFGER